MGLMQDHTVIVTLAAHLEQEISTADVYVCISHELRALTQSEL